jgi:predicted nucleotidyltransferase
MQTLTDIQTNLRQIQPFLQQAYQVAQLGIFGSYVRGEQTPTSDLDILVEFNPDTRFGLVTFCELENYLSETLALKVDLVMKTGLKSHIGDRILHEVIYL